MRKIKEVHIRWVGIPILSFIMTFLIDDDVHDRMSLLEEFFISVIFTAILWNGVFMIIKWMRRRFDAVNQTAKRLVLTFFYSALFLTIGSNMIGVSLGLCSFSSLQSPEFFFRHAHLNFISAFTIASIYEATYFFQKWRESVIQNEALKSQQIRTQYGVLQNQMSPHFLFNSLNTLTTLITEDQKTAIDFTQTLSEVYRYILQNKERELVRLDEEIEFCEGYIFLLKKRFPENFHVRIGVDAAKRQLYIAPLTIQMLIENAIKHNIVSKNQPLVVDIHIDETNRVTVSNNLQMKTSLEKSTKLGLDNIKKRYELLGQREISVSQSDEQFIVKVPLIELISEVEHLKSAV
ncbi:sensor histidine kinase [Reichenbachiella agariperforans]|uniref:sensor histidine kinase n=1 Tax=Reichenbachiella agariperforans TaxID=156994 RepID=UPI001C093668|nr:histidine kinase [Reichenbachiella agariperforans]MBU2915429.1 histidine kinase [Reichenbachiella agariperforans]